MNDKFTTDLQDRLSEFMNNVSYETLSEAFTKANFEGYRHLKGSFFGLSGGVLSDIPVANAGRVALNIAGAYDLLSAIFIKDTVAKAADHEDLALAA